MKTSVAFGAFVFALAFAGCTGGSTLTVDGSDGGTSFDGGTSAKNRFVEDGVAADAQGWTGEAIDVKVDGVAISVNGGVDVQAESGRTEVAATARLLAMASSADKIGADQSIQEAKATFKITKSGDTITVLCGHGGTHGTSNAGDSGCEKVTVLVPAGTNAQKLRLNVLSGNGAVNLKLSGASLGTVGVNAQGDLDAVIPATAGGSVSLVAEKADDVTAHLPSDFTADEIILAADADKTVNDFSDAKIGAGAGGRGTKGAGLASLKLTSKSFAGSTGKVTLTR